MMCRRSWLAVAVVVVGCGGARERPPEAATARTTSAQRPAQAPASFRVAEEIRRSCVLPIEDDRSPHFDFDSAALGPRGTAILDAVATCLVHGPLAGRAVLVTGYTDAQGPADYNEQLGMYRAVAAKLRLEAKGVPAARVEIRSVGEREASRGEAASARRIEIELVPSE